MQLLRDIWKNRELMWNLSKNDFKTKYAGSYLGIVWAFIQPVITILVYWFVFSVGLRQGEGDAYPFVLVLVSGLVPWFFFQDALNGATNAMLEYSYLVKKVVFQINILPVVKMISALFVHLFFTAFTMLLMCLYGFFPTLYVFQVLYYCIAMFLMILGISYATSAIVVFFQDLKQIINIVLQVGVWATPIMWQLSILDKHPLLQKLFKLNPMYYIVEGYRDSLLYGQGFWTKPWLTLYFWCFTIVCFLIGAHLFKKLKVHFADML